MKLHLFLWYLMIPFIFLWWLLLFCMLFYGCTKQPDAPSLLQRQHEQCKMELAVCRRK